MKTVVIVTHPNGESSLINKRWVEELAKHPDKYLLHDLYSLYPDEKLDIEKEQQLIEAYDTIVFPFSVLLVQLSTATQKVVRRSLGRRLGLWSRQCV